MTDTAVRMRIMVLGILALGAVYVYLLVPLQQTDAYLQVHFLDVGQGDAIFIESSSGTQVLIDGGKNESVLRELSKVMDFADRDIDMVIGTHPDADHIGGLTHVLKQYAVDTILTTENSNDSDTSVLYTQRVQQEGAEIIYARRGQAFALDASTTLRVLFPEHNPQKLESNTSSIVVQLQYGESTFMLTGDAPKSIEEYLVLVEGEALQSDVLKVGHHGSRTSTSELFLDEVRPHMAIISAGKENSYGHPHVEVTDMLFNARVETLQTMEEGTITLLSDGKTVWRK